MAPRPHGRLDLNRDLIYRLREGSLGGIRLLRRPSDANAASRQPISRQPIRRQPTPSQEVTLSRKSTITPLLVTTMLAGVGPLSPVLAQESAAVGSFTVEQEEGAGEILFEADSVGRDEADGPIIAEGDVRAFFGQRYLRADRLTYDPESDVVTAEGNVSITDEDMETVFAGRVILSGDLRDGIAENFSALLAENARIAADSAIQEQGARTRLNRAVYTACNVCDSDGDAKTPTWRIKSLRVTRDLERKVIRFHHAFLEIKGVPILYTPFLQGPDPTVERQSGFLTPRVGASSRLGFNFELPYYFALSNSHDATFYPKFTAADGVLWQGEYRRRATNGYHVFQGGVIDFDNDSLADNGIPFNEQEIPGVRWHYFGRGYQNFGDHWRASYDVERVSDDTYLRRYDVERRGDLRQTLDRGRTNQLRSNARLARTGEHSRLTIDTFLFQGLRTSDDASTTPYILPLIDYEHRLTENYFGGDIALNANLASIYRIAGTDSQRFTASANWENDIITDSGHRFNFFGQIRSDAFFYQDLDQGTEICNDPNAACADDFFGLRTQDDNEFVGRLAPTVGAEWSFPVAKRTENARFIIEPRVQLVASPSGLNDDIIVNEDSQSIEFDYAGLFDWNKATGFDAFEDGQRANVGVSASAVWDSGIELEGSLGRQFRLQDTEAFDFSSGLGETSSDYVGSLNFRYKNIAGFENRFRFDDDGRFDRAESMAYFQAGPVRGNVSYVRLNEENVNANLIRREELSVATVAKIARHWTVGADWRLNLATDTTTRQSFSLGYEDECATFGITYRRDRTRTENLEPDNSVLVTFSLKSLVQ